MALADETPDLHRSWGMAQSARARTRRPRDLDALREVFAEARRSGLPLVLRGGGNSYGDAALLENGLSVDMRGMDRLISWDPATGILTCEPGFTLRRCWETVLPDGYWPPVVSGTMHITLGGGCAMNVHGKNAFGVGPIGDHVVAFDLLLPSGDLVTCSREENAELFFAAIGGFGMLGAFTRIAIRQKKVHSGLIAVTPHAVESFAEGLALIDGQTATADYLVGWHDGLAPAGRRGRGIVHAARHLEEGEDEDPAAHLDPERHRLPTRFFGVVPKTWLWMGLWGFLNRPGMRLLNAAKYRSGRLHARRGAYLQPHAAYHFLLDYVPNWKYAYLPGGLIQFQPFVPADRSAEVFPRLVDLMHEMGHPPYLCVTKRHRPDAFLMTHGLDGHSLAMDVRVTAANRASVWRMTERLEDEVAAAGGRFYFAKDSVMRARNLARCFPAANVEAFARLKRTVDPGGLIQSELFRRVFADHAFSPSR